MVAHEMEYVEYSNLFHPEYDVVLSSVNALKEIPGVWKALNLDSTGLVDCPKTTDFFAV
jgi:hypothetical protein